MFERQIAKITSDHLRTHIKGYLDEVNTWYDEPVTIVVPKRIEPASMAGGVFAAPLDLLPYYGVDCIGKQPAPRAENAWCYEYTGHIAGLVSSSTRSDVDALVKAHKSAVERFVTKHLFLHQENNSQFSILEFDFLSSSFSGAEMERNTDDSEFWIAGFEVDVVWYTSENGPGQH